MPMNIAAFLSVFPGPGCSKGRRLKRLPHKSFLTLHHPGAFLSCNQSCSLIHHVSGTVIQKVVCQNLSCLSFSVFASHLSLSLCEKGGKSITPIGQLNPPGLGDELANDMKSCDQLRLPVEIGQGASHNLTYVLKPGDPAETSSAATSVPVDLLLHIFSSFLMAPSLQASLDKGKLRIQDLDRSCCR